MSARRRKRGGTPAHSRGELGQTLNHIKKQYGDRSVNLASQIPQPRRISTGSFILDFALLGGIPESRVSMVVGERSGGKSTLATKIAASAQAMYPDQTPVLIDVERTFDATWAKKLGLDTESMPVIECDSGEMVVDVTEAAIGSAETSLVIVDSVAAITPMKEIDDSAEDQHVGIQARLVARLVRKASAALVKERLRDHTVTLLLVNQFRSKIGVKFGDPRSIPGGKALEYCTSVQIIIKNKENKGKENKGKDFNTDVDAVTDMVGFNEHAFTITKNKLNNGPRAGEFTLLRTGEREGQIEDSKTLLAYAKKFTIYSGGGSKWTLDLPNGQHTYRKQEHAILALSENPDLYKALRDQIIKAQATTIKMPSEFIKGIGK